jgi:Skp family chaperone for outer membrane proteins
MKFLPAILILSLSTEAMAFNFNSIVEKVKNDPKAQEQIKEAAKKGYEYLTKKEVKGKKEEAKTTSPTKN